MRPGHDDGPGVAWVDGGRWGTWAVPVGAVLRGDSGGPWTSGAALANEGGGEEGPSAVVRRLRGDAVVQRRWLRQPSGCGGAVVAVVVEDGPSRSIALRAVDAVCVETTVMWQFIGYAVVAWLAQAWLGVP